MAQKFEKDSEGGSQSDQKDNSLPNDITFEATPDVAIPPLCTVYFQFFGLLLALSLIYMRKHDLPTFGFRFDLFGGLMPAECFVLSVLIGEMALRECGIDIVGWWLGGVEGARLW